MSNIKFCLRLDFCTLKFQYSSTNSKSNIFKIWIGNTSLTSFGLLMINVRMPEYKYILKIVKQYHLHWKMNNVCKLIVAKCDHVTFVWALTVQENADNIFSFSASNKQFYIYRYIAAIKRFQLCFHAIKSDFFCVSSSRHFAILLYYGFLWSVAF